MTQCGSSQCWCLCHNPRGTEGYLETQRAPWVCTCGPERVPLRQPTGAAALKTDAGAGYGLSRTQLTVARRLVLGDSNKEIANTLTVSLRTVKGHVSCILDKTRSDNRTRAVLKLLPYLGTHS